MAGNLLEISEVNFQNEVLDSNMPVLVDFWAGWCGPCKALAPTLETVANEKNGTLKVCKIDIDNNPTLAGRYGVRSIPTLLLFKNGQNIGQMIGNVSKHALDDFINKNI